jgi:hypothetical protein
VAVLRSDRRYVGVGGLPGADPPSTITGKNRLSKIASRPERRLAAAHRARPDNRFRGRQRDGTRTHTPGCSGRPQFEFSAPTVARVVRSTSISLCPSAIRL